ncbi:MAG: C25 family cysteine peptidase [Bacteroidetes bacterium]|nr:C25 family cysteine peptidase [Bacteroidota bacterium]
MKKLLLYFSFTVIVFGLRAQPFGNEWVNPTLTYYKISVTQDGLYRLNFSTLSSTIPNVGLATGSSFAMYHNGQAIPLYVSSGLSPLSNGGYIEFYGEKNKGYIDSLLYRTADDQLNASYSLFTDTSIYFLTINPNGNNLRYTELPNNLLNPPARENYFIKKQIVNYPTGSYYDGKYYTVISVGTSEEVYKSLYETGEGYAFSSYFNHVNQDFIVATPHVYTSGPNSVFKTNYANNSNFENHNVNISWNGNPIVQNQFHNGFQLNKTIVSIPISQLNNGNNTATFVANDNAFSQKQNIVGYLEINYPRDFDADAGNTFSFSAAAGPSTYVEINNYNDNGTQPVLYDLTNGYFYKSAQPAGSAPLKFHLLSSSVNREMYLRSGDASASIAVTKITPVNFVDYTSLSNQSEYVIITASSLLNDGTGHNYVEDYRAYREGKYQQPRIVDIDLLYDQFGFGIRKSPLAVRNFINYATSTWSLKPKYVFIVGKGRESKFVRNNAAARAQCLVPTFGFPGSDNLLAATRQNDFPKLAIGRLATEKALDVKNYLEKIKVYEAEQNSYDFAQVIAPKIWQKQILHFSGGTSNGEQINFRNYLSSYAVTAVDTQWGAHITAFSKNSSDPIDLSQSQIIKDKINQGVSWITFFGHSATGAFDFSIDEPENYSNQGKYPVILSNGCFSGFIHDATPGYSERFVLGAEKGAIAFMATSSLSTSSGLYNFSAQVYQKVCDSSYTMPLGKALQNALVYLYTNPTNFNSDNDMMVAYEMTLHGDPGLKVNQYPKPDYAIDGSSVFFTPSTIQPGTDSFEVNVIVTNLGKAIKDSIAVTLKRTLFDASGTPVTYNYRMMVRAPYYVDTVAFKLPVNVSSLGYGQNLFEPYVEADFKIDEMAEGNNGLLAPVSIYIQNDDIIPIYPYEFAIVPKQGVILKASTVNPFAIARNYKFELDTSELFAAPLQTGSVFQGGGVVHFPTTITLKDSTVYYWRVQKDSASAAWHYSSFIYLKDEFPGWNQSHYFQWGKDDYTNIKLDTDRVFKYPPTVNNIHVLTGNGFANNPQFESLGWDYNSYNEYRWRMGNCGGGVGYNAGLTFAVIDNVTGVPLYSYNNNGDNYGDNFYNIHCSGQYYRQSGFDFLTKGANPGHFNEPWSTTIKRFIDFIPNNFYVLVYSVNQVPYTSWDATLVSSLQSLGFVQAQNFADTSLNGPLVFFTQKGNLSYPSFTAYKNGYATALDTSVNFIGNWNTGFFTTPKIGPAVSWGSVHWKRTSFQNQATDKDSLDVIGVNLNGFDTVLRTTSDSNLYFFGADTILASQFPYLKLRLHTTDDALRTPAQLTYWRVLYKKPPEAAINPAAHFAINNPVNLGQNLHVEVALENVTDVRMDSMLTKYVLRDAQFNNQNFSIRQDTLGGLDTMILVFDKPVSGANFNGLNKLIIEANPENDQLEQYHFNNIAEINFTSVSDKINPLLDVTFDNQHILNGDIVSAQPNILITLKDENKFLALNDTALVNVYLKYPNETTPRRMSYDDVIMKFYPADSTKLNRGNKAQIELKPGFISALSDGVYELIVKDRDRSGNNSSTTVNRYEGNVFYDYKIDFEIINKPMITNILNYPNPFTTSTKFVFTLTGTEVPDFMKIQIMTIRGIVVKEIFKEELGQLHIGNNITEYAWDGRDQYGDQLSNGIYFYTVSTRMDNKEMDHLSEGFDKYFKKGFGKMAIVR